MIIHKFEAKYGFFTRFVEFGDKQNIIHSKKNSVGKSTLFRLILFSLGYSVPSTRGLDFDDIETNITLENNKTMYTITRNQKVVSLKTDRLDELYIVPYDITEMHKIIFDISNTEVIENLLGVYFVDQEKGWTFLNRGKVIGNNKFNIEGLVRGLSGRSCKQYIEELLAVKHEIKKYKQMFSTAEYQKQLNELCENVAYDNEKEELSKQLDICKLERKPVADELYSINKLIKQNTLFKEYVNSMKLIVQNDEGVIIPVNENTLIGYNDNYKYLETKKMMLSEQLYEIESKMKILSKRLQEEETIFEVNTLIHNYDHDISQIYVDERAVNNVLNKLSKEQQELKNTIYEFTKRNNDVVDYLHKVIQKYALEMGVNEKYVPSNKDYIFTKDLKSLTGAILYKIIFIFKLAYISAVEKYTGQILPIIMDSPNGREIKINTIKKMMNLLKRDFGHHQIIVASIYLDNFEEANKIEIKESLFENI